MKYCIPIFCLYLFAAAASFADTIYRCELADGTISLQQQRCSGTTEQKRYSFSDKIRSDRRRSTERPEQDETPQRTRRQTPSRSNSKPRRKAIGKQLTQCRKLWNREEDLRDTERTGYTAKEGEKMRREHQRIKRDKELLHCDELE